MKKIILFLSLFLITFNVYAKEERSTFFSYIELSDYVKGKSRIDAYNNIDNVINNLYENKFNTIYLQVRSHDDAIYKSKEFKVSSNIILLDNTYFDVLKYFIKKCKNKKIKVFAWINPFRIDSSNFYDPADISTKKHILKGIDEVLKYDINGIIFDDYFYTNDLMDNKEYLEYIKTHNISRKDYHLMIIRDLLYSVNKRVKKKNKKILFGISPSGNINNLYNKDFVDIKILTKNKKYIDFVMPQVYYGFNNSSEPFYDVIKSWDDMSNIPIVFALALYKSCNIDKFAGNGYNEWIENNDIIKREIILSRNKKHYKGFSIYRYDNMFNKSLINECSKKEILNIKSLLKNKK